MLGPVLLQVVLILLNAVFASAEIAVISTKETRLKKLASEGNRRAAKLFSLTEQPARFLATIQVAITLAGLLGSAFAAENFAGALAETMRASGVPISIHVLKSASVFFITLILAYFNLVFGELVPKRIAMKKAESMALGMSGMLCFVAKAFAPVVWILTASTNGILRLLRINPEEEGSAVTEEEIRLLLMEGKEQGTIPNDEHEMIRNIFAFDDISVEQICTRRREVVSLSITEDMIEWEQQIYEHRHTCYPVCGEELENIVGVLDTRDYFRMADKGRTAVMEQAVSPALFVPENMKANSLFKRMKEQREYFAIVIDEYGGFSGIITLHDLVEALVGDLEESETPTKPKDIEQVSENVWKIQGCAELEDVSDALNVPIFSEDYDTFSGYICGEIGRIPAEGENFRFETGLLQIDVENVANHMIEKTTVTRRAPQEDTEK